MPEWVGQVGAIGIAALVLYALGRGLITIVRELITVVSATTKNYEAVRNSIDRQNDANELRLDALKQLTQEIQGNSIITASVKDAVAAAQKASELAAAESVLTRRQIEDVTRRIHERGLEVERALLPAVWALDAMQRDVQKYLEAAPDGTDGTDAERYKLVRGLEVALDTHIGLLLDGSRKLLTDAAKQIPEKTTANAEGDTRP